MHLNIKNYKTKIIFSYLETFTELNIFLKHKTNLKYELFRFGPIRPNTRPETRPNTRPIRPISAHLKFPTAHFCDFKLVTNPKLI
jgi:hypothetical protein